MRLPFSIELGYFNHLLFTITALSEGQDSCDVSLLVSACKSQVYDGRYVDYSRVLELASFANLIHLTNNRASLTSWGEDFLRENPETRFEPNPNQKRYISSQLVLSGPWENAAKKVLSNFLPNYKEITFEFPISETEALGPEFKAALHLFWVLGILIKQGDLFQVNSEYVKHVNAVRTAKRRLTQAEVEGFIEQNVKLGFKAEELVVEFEKKRLRTLGRNAEADRVLRISDLEANAGFDIKSFNGDRPSIKHDRFIEVKSSQMSKLNFYWSLNEFDTSKELADRYWIYFIGDFTPEKNSLEINPVMIQDPFASIVGNPGFDITPTGYKITQNFTIL